MVRETNDDEVFNMKSASNYNNNIVPIYILEAPGEEEVLYYDFDLGGEPMNFFDVFLHSQALEGITLSMIICFWGIEGIHFAEYLALSNGDCGAWSFDVTEFGSLPMFYESIGPHIKNEFAQFNIVSVTYSIEVYATHGVRVPREVGICYLTQYDTREPSISRSGKEKIGNYLQASVLECNLSMLHCLVGSRIDRFSQRATARLLHAVPRAASTATQLGDIDGVQLRARIPDKQYHDSISNGPLHTSRIRQQRKPTPPSSFNYNTEDDYVQNGEEVEELEEEIPAGQP
ncbi:hypothetical protein Syun_021037 [Stephania yunnanensis]|uniref:Uncharacterized protein n=1 Tax=Stephania yunnanensis TaxID=152371 RepID=A0AAP0IFM6_9MAGN